ncbi:zinc finger protein 236-like [Chelonus insularis]|uniref:zinc finger protein 236-like n=1 Tax=Chelonus insularis TaxID=460826 RepID=UPI00158D6088|nr:zinc finger protein 236-like [Chelonus insularis]
MARAIIYNGHSSVVPIFDGSQNGFIPIIKIKEEPIDDDKNDEENANSMVRNISHNLRSKQSASKKFWDENDEGSELTPKRLTRRSAAIEASKRFLDDGVNAKGIDYDNNSKTLSKEVSPSKTINNANKSPYDTFKSLSRPSWECEICYASFSDPYFLKKHIGYYTPSSLRCRKCNKIFGDVYKLMHHRETVHRNIDQSANYKFQCDFCKQLLKTKQNIQQHICHYHKDEIGTTSGQSHNTNQTKNLVMSPSTRLNTSDLSIRQHRAVKRKRAQSCSFAENRPIIPEHSINTRLNSERKSLLGIPADSHEDITSLSDKSQLSNSNSPKKLIPNTKFPGNSSYPPLVQIYAIPNEVEALLSDCEDISAKRMKLQVLSNKNSDNGTKIDYNLNRSSFSTPIKLEDSSRTFARTIQTLKENFNCLDCSVKLEKLKTLPDPSKGGLDKLLNTSKSPEKSSKKSPEKLLEKLPDKSPEKPLEKSSEESLEKSSEEPLEKSSEEPLEKSSEEPLEKSSEEPLEILFDKSLEKPSEKSASGKESLPVNGPIQTSSITSNLRSSTPTICGTIEIELENLDIALKKLKTPKRISDTRCSSSSIFSLDGINMEHSYSAAPSVVPAEEKKTEENNESKQPAKIKSIYLSSICRTRFTTQKKLIYHYLNYHSYPNYICAVCRTECSRLGELKKHLAVHCISIVKSLDDRSPIDLKGPCENSKKKFICKGCKKCFPTLTCLEEHTGQCSILEARREKKRQSSTHETSIVNDQNSSENLVINHSEESPALLQPSSSESKLKEFENNSSEMNYPSQPAPPTLPLSIPPTIPPNIDTHKDSINKLELTLQNMEKWSQYTHSVAPRQKPSTVYLQHQCKTCYSRFQSEDNLNEHVKKYEPKHMSRCEKCGTCFPSIGLLSAHKKAAHSTDVMAYRKYCCFICDQGFSKKKNLHHHTMHIHCAELIVYNKSPELDTEYEMTCKICYVAFKTRKQFIEHSMYYYDNRTVTCDVCGEEFEGQYKAHAHIQQVHFKKFYTSYTYSCKKCQDRFKYESHLRSHIFHVHKDQIVNSQCTNQHQPRQCFVCSVCTECFYTPKLLKEHKMEFSNTGPYECNECDRKCETLQLLKEHKKRSHYEIRPHFKKCYLCSEFVSPNLWLVHSKHFHENVPPLELYMRNYTESRKSQEPNVLTTYGNDKNQSNFGVWISSEQFLENVIEYTCAICDMKFKSDNELKEHRKIHKYNDPDVTTPQQKDGSENHDLAPFTFVNQETFEPEPPVGTYESDEDTKYNFAIANICSVELKEYDSLYNPDTTNKEMNSIGDNCNHCDACHYNRKLEYSDHTYQKLKRHKTTCNETLTTRNVKQTSLPNVHREFPASNQPKLIVKSKETVEVPQKISTSSAQSSLGSDPQPQQKKPSGTCKIQTTINQYFQKSPSEKNISALCDICGLAFEKSSALIHHKNNDHRKNESLQNYRPTQIQSSNNSQNTNTPFPLSFKDPLITPKSSPQKYVITIRDDDDDDEDDDDDDDDDDETSVINNCTDILTRPPCTDNFQKSSSLSGSSMDNNQFQRITLVDSGILYSYLQKPVN